MLFSYGSGQQQIDGNKKCMAQFRFPWQCSGTTRSASPDGAHLGLHLKPLDAAISRVPVPYCPSSRHGRQIQMKHTKQ
jgi:hypothetical protein